MGIIFVESSPFGEQSLHKQFLVNLPTVIFPIRKENETPFPFVLERKIALYSLPFGLEVITLDGH